MNKNILIIIWILSFAYDYIMVYTCSTTLLIIRVTMLKCCIVWFYNAYNIMSQSYEEEIESKKEHYIEMKNSYERSIKSNKNEIAELKNEDGRKISLTQNFYEKEIMTINQKYERIIKLYKKKITELRKGNEIICEWNMIHVNTIIKLEDILKKTNVERYHRD